MSAHVPAKRLAGFYFWYYAAIGVLIPYLGLYLTARGLSPAQIGTAIGLLALTRIFAPYVWGYVADHSARRMPIVWLTLGGALLSFAALPAVNGPLLLCAVLVVYGLMVNGTMAQFEVVTFGHLAAQSDRYARIRSWGSTGFVFAVLSIGPLLERYGVTTLPLWIAGMFGIAWFISRRIPEPPRPPPEQVLGSMLDTLKNPAIGALLLACFFAQVAYGPYYGFFSIYLNEHGYRKDVIGLLWALGVIAEVAVFWFIPKVLPRLSLPQLFMWSQAATALRWVLTVWLVDHPALLAVAQLLHAVSFGLYHLAAVSLIQRLFPSHLLGRAQAVYIGVSYGIGGAIGGFVAGQLWELIPPDRIWYLASLMALCAWWVCYRGFRLSDASGRPLRA